MSNANKNSSGRNPSFGSAAREARRADAQSVDEPSVNPKNQDAGGGFDPYNTSGSFDRRKNWERVGKR